MGNRCRNTILARCYATGLVMVCGVASSARAMPGPAILADTPVKMSSRAQSESVSPLAAPRAQAEVFSAQGVGLLSQVPLNQFSSNSSAASDIWGYVSPSGREYAIIGLRGAVAFVEVTDPSNPVIVAEIAGPNSSWRDMRVHGTYCYNVIEQTGQGMQVIDLSDIDNGNVTLVNTTTLGGQLSSSHNVILNPTSGFLYLALSGINNARGLVAVDTTDPVNPTLAGLWSTPPGVRCHDAFVTTYTSGTYAGREIAFCFAEDDGLWIADVTNKNNMFTMGTVSYPNVSYSHQGWLSEDLRYIFLGDELDELNSPAVPFATTYVIDVQDLNNPLHVATYSSGITTIDHNMMVRGNFLYEANYRSGLRILDVSDVNNITEVGFFDTHPPSDTIGFDGAWGVYTQLPSGIVIVSDINRGLFVLDTTIATGDAQPPVPGELSRMTDAGIPKHRYVSFAPATFNTVPMAHRFTRVDPAGQAVSRWVRETVATGPLGGKDVSFLSNVPVFRVWTEPAIHVLDCEIAPGNQYEIESTFDGVTFSLPVTIATAPLPLDGRAYGDAVGVYDTLNQRWTESDGAVNANEISAAILAFELDVQAPHFTVVDVAADGVTNSLDITLFVDAFQFQPDPSPVPENCP